MLEEWNDTRSSYPKEQCIHQLFETQVKRTPDAVAVVFQQEQLTYRELNARANQLAHHLQALGVGPEVLVGIYMERSLEIVVGILGVLKAGGAYVPLDPVYPKERLAFMLEDAQVAVLLTQERLVEVLTEHRARLVCLDKNWKEIAQEREKNPFSSATADNLAYVIYTSGSTGKPKGVLVEHKGLCNLVMTQIWDFDVKPECRILQFASFSFDASVSEVFMALLAGATLYLEKQEFLLPGPGLLRLLRDHAITTVTLPPSVLAVLPTEELPALRTIISAGETCSADIVARWAVGCRFFNAYGATEVTICSTVAECSDGSQKPTIGRAIANTQTYVLDVHLQSQPVGVPGELHYGGIGLTRGYLNRPDLTAEKFIPNPFSNEPGARLYKTGDLVRYLPNGNIDFLGRIDHQVKIRGFRIELGEIEAVLRQHPGLQTTVVVARDEEQTPGNKRLVAYAVPQPHQLPSTTELRSFLKTKLPEYMLPSVFVLLDALPLTPSGKVDRRALPHPNQVRPEIEVAIVPPQTPTEKLLVEIWTQLFNGKRLGIYDNFFELGGNSLLATQLMFRVCEAFQVELPLHSLFEWSTVAEMAAVIAQNKGKQPRDEFPLLADLPKIEPDKEGRHKPFALTDVQQAYWIGRNGTYELSNVSTHGYLEIDCLELDCERFNQAWQQLIDQHDMLRAVFLPDGRQQILPQVPPYRIQFKDLRQADPETRQKHLEAVREEMSHQVLPSDQWPLFKIRGSLVEERVRLHISLDLLIADAWSLSLLFQSLFQLYQHPEHKLVGLELSFRDYVLAAQRLLESALYQRSVDYWRQRLLELPPAPELPLARNPRTLTLPRFVRRAARLAEPTYSRLKARGSRSGLTPSGVLLAAFTEVIGTWSKSPRFSLNLTLFNRLPLHPQVNDIVGDFTELTLLAVDNSVPESFELRALRWQKQLWQDLEHRYYSGVRVLRDLASQQGGTTGALMPVVFTSTVGLSRTEQDIVLNEAENDMVSASLLGEVVYNITQTPQVWLDHQVFVDASGALVFNWDAVEELFPTGLLDDMFDAYCDLLNRLATDEDSWHATVQQLLPPAQLELLAALNATEMPIPQGMLHTLFAAQALARPQQLAVVCSGRTLTYEELSRRSNQVGRRLRQLGAAANTLVAVVMEKGWEQVVAVLGVLNSGAAYLPLDPNLPQERLWFLLEHAQVKLVLTQSRWAMTLDWPESVQPLGVDGLDLMGVDDQPLEPVQEPEDLAYVIYTSGSTGQPKGVMVNHRSVVNTIVDINSRFEVEPLDRVLALSSLSFDLSVYDIFGTLAAGATIVLPDAAATRDPADWAQLIAKAGVTVWNSVPALMQMLVEYASAQADLRLHSLRLVLLSGDWIPLNLPIQIKFLVAGVQVISLGGATEASIWSIIYPIEAIDPAIKSIPYGKPMRNQHLYVLNQALQPCPVWVPGELYIGGVGLALGYWQDQEKTRVSFLTHPRTGERLYRTGDLGRYLPDGNIEFLGRSDFQVKIQGHRIELGEIEAALMQHPTVRQVVVVATGKSPDSKRLVAYLVCDQKPESNDIPGDAPFPQTDGVTRNPDKVDKHSFYNPSTRNERSRIQGLSTLSGNYVGVLLDPIQRLEFKLKQPGLRQDLFGRPFTQLVKPKLDENLQQTYFTKRRSHRQFLQQPIACEQFSQFLSCLFQLQVNGSALPKYRYGSAGGLYPVQIYLYIKPKRVEGLTAGTYYYDPQQHRLVLLTAEAVISREAHAPTNFTTFEQSAFSLFLVGQLNAITPMYGNQARDFCLIEAGLISQLLETSAPDYHLGLCQIGGFDFERVRHLFALDQGHEYLYSLLGGRVEDTENGMFPENPSPVLSSKAWRDRQSQGNGVVAELKSYLQQKLPEYMVPAAFVLLDTLPLTPNGKVDRKALPEPDIVEVQSQVVYVAPQSEVECAIAAVWQQVLQLDQVGVHDNFFDLGGNSIHLVRVCSKLQEMLKPDLSVLELFTYPTVSSLAKHLSQRQSVQVTFEQSEVRTKIVQEGKSRLEQRLKQRQKGSRKEENNNE